MTDKKPWVLPRIEPDEPVDLGDIFGDATAFDIGEMQHPGDAPADSTVIFAPNPLTGEPTTWEITLGADHHPTVARALRKVDEKRKQFWTPWRRRHENIRIGALRTAARIIGWTPVAIDGTAFPFSPNNALMLVLEPKLAKITAAILDELDRSHRWREPDAAAESTE